MAKPAKSDERSQGPPFHATVGLAQQATTVYDLLLLLRTGFFDTVCATVWCRIVLFSLLLDATRSRMCYVCIMAKCR
jgi:hypothetical protein